MLMLTELGKSRAKVEYLATQLGIANTHLYIFRKLRDAQEGEFRRELHKALDFWHYTINAHIQAAIVHLCRVYDWQKDHPWGRTLHLLRLLEEISHLKLTSAESKHLQADLRFLQRPNLKVGTSPGPVVAKLRVWRNNLIAHRNYDLTILGIDDFLKQHPVDLQELQGLVDRGFEILDRWKRYHGHQSDLQRLAEGKDDYAFVLHALRQSLQQARAGCSQDKK
jgi:AbiU2